MKMETATISRNFKKCPLKKRPVVYEVEPEIELSSTVIQDNEQPQDLSLKRKTNDALEDYAPAMKREYVLNLSSKPMIDISPKYRPESPISEYSAPSTMFSPSEASDIYGDYHPTNIHLRGLTTATNSYTTNPYQSAFVMAAGCNPMTALWHTYQQTPVDLNAVYPSPASSIQSPTSTVYGYSYQQMTPPSSPGSEDSAFEPEDLSVRSDIPLPALFHQFDKASHSSAMSISSSSHSVYERNSMKTSSVSSLSSTSSSSSASSSLSSSNSASSKHYRFKCEKCNKMYSTSMGLSKHQQFHCPAAVCNQEKQQHSCQECGKLYTTIGALKMHIRTHTLPCKCPICGKAFSRPWLLQGHIRTHTGEKPFQCPDCPRSFADRSNLRAHQQTHVDVKKYVCQVCNKSFSRMSLLNKHVSSNCTITIV